MSALATTSMNPEPSLITKARNGDTNAFAALYETHKPLILGVCLKMTKNMTEAEDLTQDAFIYGFRKISTFRGDSAFSTWLHRVAVNTVLMHFRRNGKRHVSLEEPVPRDSHEAKREYGQVDERLAGCADRMALAQATLSWSSQGATSIVIDHGVGSVAASGSTVVSPTATTIYTALASGNGQTTQASATVTVNAATGSIESVKHIIFMLQENRTFDNYFGQLNRYRATQGLPQDVDGLPSNASNPSYDGTTVVPAYHIKTVCAENQSPSWDEEHTDANRNDAGSSTATMDGFVFVAGKYSRDTGGAEIQGIRVMGYYDETDIPYYYFMASQFATSDRWFAPVMSNSMVNRIYGLAGTSAGHAYPFATTLTNMNIFELLENNNISWKVYLTPASGVPDDPEDTGNTFLLSFQPFASQHLNKIVPVSQYLTDAANGTLPAVSLIETAPGVDEHPGKNVQTGVAYVATLVNTLMASPSWADSVFILSWDEAGGLYDHIPPAAAVKPDGISPIDLTGHIQGDFDRTGFRLPLLVISPFTKPHYVSHNPADYTAVLKFIETRYNLPSMTNRDAAQIDMTEFFDFANVPWRIPPTPPSQPTTGVCDYAHLQ